jgi:sulfotransferase
MSGPVAGLVGSLLTELSSKNEFAPYIDDGKRNRIIQSVFSEFYAETKAEVVFDTSRAWCARMSLIKTLYPEAKVIACVRHMPWIIDSIEQLVQCNVFQPSSIFNYLTGGTVYSRADGVAGSDGMVGYAYNALKEAFFGGNANNRLLLLQYETLTTNPEKALRAIYDFIGEPYFNHDFDHINFDATEFDKKAGTPGLHNVRSKVDSNQRTTILPPDIFRRFENDAFWMDATLNRNSVPII